MKKGFFSKVSFVEFAILVFFIIELNCDWNQSQILHWGSVGLLMLGHISKNGGKLDIKFEDYSLWFGGVIIISIISLVFSLKIGVSVGMLKSLLVIFVAFFVIRNYITDEEKIIRILFLYIIAVTINMVYVIMSIDLSVIGDVQIGDEAIDGWNGNTIGLMAVSAAILCIYMMFQSKNILTKILYLAVIVFFSYLFLYTGSRKAIVMFVCCLVVMLFVSSPKKMIRNTLLTAVILYGAYMLVMNVESIYNVLGVRLEGLFAAIAGEGEVDSSTLLRQEYINNGWKWIKESPITGYGLDCYRVLNGPVTGHSTYSHNNFIEMAINWGVFGFAYYYSAYLLIIKRFFKCLKNNLLGVTIFTLFVGNLCLHYGMVAYYDIWQNLLLCIGFTFVNTKKNDCVKEREKDVE